MRQLAYGSIIQISMQNSSHKSSPRPFVYRTKADIQQFVMGNASQAYSVNLPFEPPRTAPNFHPASSLFDRYNRNNLLLRECDAKDVTTLHKNLIMAEQPLSRYAAMHLGRQWKKCLKKESRNRENWRQLDSSCCSMSIPLLNSFARLLHLLIPHHHANTSKTRSFSTTTRWGRPKRRKNYSF